MTIDISVVYLWHAASGQSVEAELRDAIEETQLVDWQAKWWPVLTSALRELAGHGVPPEHWPRRTLWDWREKTERVRNLLAFKGFCVVAEGETQGLAQINLNPVARELTQVGKPMVGLEYLEVAPWNRADLFAVPRFRGVGTALLAAAVQLSIEEGFKGRVGLHSLPSADDFYRSRGMTDLGSDPAHQRLTYFEFTAAQAAAFLKEEDDEI